VIRRESKSRFYSLLTALLTPVVLARLALRGLKSPAYFRRWRERFGVFPAPGLRQTIWVHAVSVGEVNAAIPLIRALMETYRDSDFVVTTITPTGSDRVQQVFGNQVFHVYLPYDLPGAVKRFLRKIKPRLAVIMETEIWPNLFRFSHKQGIPVVVANARLSEMSLKGYKWVQTLAAMAFNNARHVAAQTRTDANRMLRLGCSPEKIYVVGSLKFDIQIDEEIRETGRRYRQKLGTHRRVWIAASTHPDDEKEVLQAYVELKQEFPDLLLVLVPRHPERFAQAAQNCRALGLDTQLRSEQGFCDEKADVFVVDTMGELLPFYAAADFAFVGGSIANVGGHNVLEAAVFKLPVLVGPNTHNFAEINQILSACGGSVTVNTAEEIAAEIRALIHNPERRRKMGEAAYRMVQENRGAVDLTMKLIANAVDNKPLPESLKKRQFLPAG